MEEKALTGEEVVQEIMKLLNANSMQKSANGVFELCAYVDGMQQKMQEMTDELSEVRKQLQEMKEDTIVNNLKKSLTQAADRLEQRCNEIKEQIFELKQSIKSKAHEICEEFKFKGKSALNKVSEFFGVKEKLQKIRENVKQGIVDTEKTLHKIEAFGLGIREANQKIANTFRTFADKPEVDYSEKEKKFSKTEVIKKPWVWQKKVYNSMVIHLDAAIDKVDNLSKDVAIAREDRTKEQRVAEDIEADNVFQFKVAEPVQYQYGADAFEAASEKGNIIGDNIKLPTAQEKTR